MCYFSFLFLQFCYIDVLYLEQKPAIVDGSSCCCFSSAKFEIVGF